MTQRRASRLDWNDFGLNSGSFNGVNRPLEQFEKDQQQGILSIVVSYVIDRDLQLSELNPLQIRTERIYKELRFNSADDELLGLYMFEV